MNNIWVNRILLYIVLISLGGGVANIFNTLAVNELSKSIDLLDSKIAIIAPNLPKKSWSLAPGETTSATFYYNQTPSREKNCEQQQ